ncbi:MAG: RHS repeat-associated core domain-containing protein [Lachnospiraceae bacterium]|nr:RHS repeat-associated core domain-containing protein [Lachnospiraceae bacterium]
MSEYAMDSPGQGSMAGDENTADIGNRNSYGSHGTYGYNGEYTHTKLGFQYLRARYYNMTTGTFTSRDTYAGTLTDILSQNRYTYAENNPVTYADPSGHFSIKNAWNKVKAGASAVTSAVKQQ